MFRRQPKPSRQRGVGLFDALVALAILAFGMLALSRLQGRMVAQTTEMQARTLAAQLADELLASALVDVDNANCYTLPAAGVCARAAARAATDAWAARVPATLPGTVTHSATLDNGRLTVALTWTGKESKEQRRLEASTDVRN